MSDREALVRLLQDVHDATEAPVLLFLPRLEALLTAVRAEERTALAREWKAAIQEALPAGVEETDFARAGWFLEDWPAQYGKDDAKREAFLRVLAAARAEEREAAARVAEAEATRMEIFAHQPTARRIAAAIRARGEETPDAA